MANIVPHAGERYLVHLTHKASRWLIVVRCLQVGSWRTTYTIEQASPDAVQYGWAAGTTQATILDSELVEHLSAPTPWVFEVEDTSERSSE